MSPTRPPVRRPQPRAVYRRRRLMVAGTAVLLVVAAVDLVRGDDEAPADTVSQVVARTDPSTPAAASSGEVVGPTTTRTRRPTAPATPTPTPEPVLAEPDGACDDADVTVRPEVGTAWAGGRVRIALALSTTKAEACTWTLGPEHLAYKITDDDGDVWSSAQCPALVPTGEVVVRRDVLATYALAWNGRASSKDCPDSMDHVAPGSYAVQAAAIGGEPSAVVPFTLGDPADRTTSGPTVPRTKATSKTRNRTRTR